MQAPVSSPAGHALLRTQARTNCSGAASPLADQQAPSDKAEEERGASRQAEEEEEEEEEEEGEARQQVKEEVERKERQQAKEEEEREAKRQAALVLGGAVQLLAHAHTAFTPHQVRAGMATSCVYVRMAAYVKLWFVNEGLGAWVHLCMGGWLCDMLGALAQLELCPWREVVHPALCQLAEKCQLKPPRWTGSWGGRWGGLMNVGWAPSSSVQFVRVVLADSTNFVSMIAVLFWFGHFEVPECTASSFSF
eukprot:1142859-Pelagomonas_calceolata.AAC.7